MSNEKTSPKPIDEDVLKAVTNAIYKSQVDSAKAELSKASVDLDDLPSIFSKLIAESETGQILIYGSYIEEKIFQLLKLRMRRNLTSSDEDEVFGNNGPLGSLSNRILVAHKFGWLSDNTKSNLDIFRKIRNSFAHEAFKVSFSDGPVAKRFAQLWLNFQDRRMSIEKVFAPSDSPSFSRLFDELAQGKKNLSSLAFLAGDVMRDLLVLPVAANYRVSPNDVAGNYDSGPDILKEISRNVARSILKVVNS